VSTWVGVAHIIDKRAVRRKGKLTALCGFAKEQFTPPSDPTTPVCADCVKELISRAYNRGYLLKGAHPFTVDAAFAA
jgi:hypothetical protein